MSHAPVASLSPEFVVVARCHSSQAQQGAARVLRSMQGLHHAIVVGSEEGFVSVDVLDAARVRVALSDAVAKENLDITVIEP